MDKADSKKEQSKNKKVKQDAKVNKNGVKNNSNFNNNKQKLPNSGAQKNKKLKGSKPQNNSSNKNIKKKRDSEGRSFLWLLITRIIYISIVLGVIYIVDIEKFIKIRDFSTYCVNKTISFLPPSVVTQGEKVIGTIQPVAEVTAKKLNVFINETSTFFNTNPLLKDHWAYIRDMGSICGALLVDYMRTLYQQTAGYYNDFKNKIF